jgi:hypothetical protein
MSEWSYARYSHHEQSFFSPQAKTPARAFIPIGRFSDQTLKTAAPSISPRFNRASA